MSARRVEAVLGETALETWAGAVGREAAHGGLLVALHGPLGAGKTTFVRSAFRAAGAERGARSPTYTLHHVHAAGAGGRLHHLDLYRISRSGELDDLAWEELLASSEATFVEWAERAGDRLPPDRWDIELSIAEEGRRRRLIARALGKTPDLPALRVEGAEEVASACVRGGKGC